MERQKASAKKIVLLSPNEAPFNFEIAIQEKSGIDSACSFDVTGINPNTSSTLTKSYRLLDREHHSYLDLFKNLAEDFGSRYPVSRRPKINHSTTVKYQKLLDRNLVPKMLYGYGDPAILLVQEGGSKEHWYYLVSTSNDAPDSFPICKSKDLVEWEFVSFVFPEGKKPCWAADGNVNDYWAPEIHKVKDKYLVYFVARDKDMLELCIGVARSTTPWGPYIADDEPILKKNNIDPHVLVEDENTAYLFWKEDNNGVWPSRLINFLYEHPAFTSQLFPEERDQITASFIEALWPWIQNLKSMEGFLAQQVFIEIVTSKYAAFVQSLRNLSFTLDQPIRNKIDYVLEVMKTPVYAQKLSGDGSNLVGEKTKIIENDQAWEAHLVEGMWVTKQLGKYYLFYAGNDFSTDQYGIGVAIAPSPLGPYRKVAGPFLQSTNEWWAPGHPSVATGPDGKFLLFLHAFFPGKAGYKEFRALLTVPITLHIDHVSLRD
jgi:arabinan endo-1,5-alpha-L-arabinosidase